MRRRTNNRLRKDLIYGVGVNDLQAHRDTPACKTWLQMLCRCYDGRKNCYKDVVVCKGWLKYSNFMCWYDQQYKEDGWQLDKDLFGKGEGVYSPRNCCFLPPKLNYTITGINSISETTGVKPNKSGTYSAIIKIDDKEKSLGLFSTAEEVSNKYLNTKADRIENLLNYYPSLPETTKLQLNSLISDLRTGEVKNYRLSEINGN